MMAEESSNSTPTPPSASSEKPIVVPVVQEELQVGLQKTETGRVQITKSVQERDVLVQQASMHEEIEVERVSVNRFIAEPASIRYEGDTMIIPVMEEVAVIETRLRLKEELRVTKRQITTPRSQSVRLRTEEVHVERVPAQSDQPGQATSTDASSE
ncbi:YsnF/AvaK domain-containing protein [Nitrospira sp. Nam74]